MKFFQNKWQMKIHLHLSLFFIPLAMIYAITGAFYILGYKDDTGAKIVEFKVNETVNKSNAKELMLKVINENGLPMPKNTDVKFVKGSFTMGNLKTNFTLSNDGKFMFKDRSLYGILVSLHKAKGGFYFNILAVGFAITLFLLYLSGLFITSFCKKNRKESLITVCLGFFVTIVAICLSI